MFKRLKGLADARKLLALSVACTTFSATTPLLAQPSSSQTATPIKHVVVIFQENVSFDHYFATYPKAANADGTPF